MTAAVSWCQKACPRQIITIGMIICFLDGPLVVICVFVLLGCFPWLILFISMILLLGRAGKASRSLRRFSGSFRATWANDLLVGFFFLFLFSSAFLSSSLDIRGGIGGGIFETWVFTVLLVGLVSFVVLGIFANCAVTLFLNERWSSTSSLSYWDP